VDAARKIFSIIASAGIVQGLILSLALLRKGRGPRKADRFLAAILLFFALNIAVPEFLFSAGQAPLHRYFLFSGTFPLVLGPLLLFYVRELQSEMDGGGIGKRRGPSYAAHAIPLFLYVVSLALLWIFGGSLPPSATSALGWAVRLSWIAILAHAATYLGIVIFLLHGHTRRLKARLSDIGRRGFSWLRILSIAFIAAYSAIAFLMTALSHGHPFVPEDKTVSLALSILVYALGWRGLFQQAMPAETERRAKYARSGISSSDSARLLEGLRGLMESEKPHLDPEIGLSALAAEAGMQPGELSRVINEAAGMNFYDFVNAYRVEEAKRLLADQCHGERSVLDIAYSAGFKSKSTFNECFRKFTGLTPKAYRQKGPRA
jgi:AraC-like DNA-binding protein